MLTSNWKICVSYTDLIDGTTLAMNHTAIECCRNIVLKNLRLHKSSLSLSGSSKVQTPKNSYNTYPDKELKIGSSKRRASRFLHILNQLTEVLIFVLWGGIKWPVSDWSIELCWHYVKLPTFIHHLMQLHTKENKQNMFLWKYNRITRKSYRYEIESVVVHRLWWLWFCEATDTTAEILCVNCMQQRRYEFKPITLMITLKPLRKQQHKKFTNIHKIILINNRS